VWKGFAVHGGESIMGLSTLKECSARVCCVVEVIRTAKDLNALQAEWEELFTTSPAAAPPLRWEWVRTWWDVYGTCYGEGGRGLRIVTIRRGPHLIGVLPLYQGRLGSSTLGLRRLGFISTGAAEFEETCTEYLNLLHVPGEEDACLEALTPVLGQPVKLGWDILQLSDIPKGSPLLRLTRSFAELGFRVRLDSTGICHLFSMAEGFEGYLKLLSHENRRQARKMLRDCEAERLDFQVATNASELHCFFDEMIDLHRRRWTAVGKQGSFASHHAQFHRRTAELLLGRGEAVIARLSQAGRPLAVVFGYRCGDRVHCYQQGIAQGVGRLRSPGTAAWLLLMRHQAGQGVTIFDHLQGQSQFKDRFATGQATVHDIHVARPGLRTMTASATVLLARIGRRILHYWSNLGEPVNLGVVSKTSFRDLVLGGRLECPRLFA
jgi:CelD/BcsL family acetyltransferase involved in cellulose biosynthesis